MRCWVGQQVGGRIACWSVLKLVFRLSVRSLVGLGRMDAFVSYSRHHNSISGLVVEKSREGRQLKLIIFMPARHCNSVVSHSRTAYCRRKAFAGGSTL